MGGAVLGSPESAGQIDDRFVRGTRAERGGVDLQDELGRGLVRTVDGEAEGPGDGNDAREHHLRGLQRGLLDRTEGDDLGVEGAHGGDPRDVEEPLDEELSGANVIDGRGGPKVEDIAHQRGADLGRRDGGLGGHLDPVAVHEGLVLALAKDGDAAAPELATLLDERGPGGARGHEPHAHVESQLGEGPVQGLQGSTGRGVGLGRAADKQRPVEELDPRSSRRRGAHGEVFGEAARQLGAEIARGGQLGVGAEQVPSTQGRTRLARPRLASGERENDPVRLLGLDRGLTARGDPFAVGLGRLESAGGVEGGPHGQRGPSERSAGSTEGGVA